jgi:flap endonuclease-1
MELKDSDGNPTAHLLGLFHRTILLIENGIKPIWVFDGKPPELKFDRLRVRHGWKQTEPKE